MIKITLSLLASLAQTRIVDDGPWDGQDWYNQNEDIGVTKGIPYSNDVDIQRRITAATASDGTFTDYLDSPNVQRVTQFLKEDKFEELFPIADDVYTYESLLQAIAKYPKFCGEDKQSDIDTSCPRELSTLFAHMVPTSGLNDAWIATPTWKQGLYHTEDPDCADSTETACDKYKQWKDHPKQTGKQYYGRGPFMLETSEAYAIFSKNVEQTYTSELDLLGEPEKLATDGYVSFLSALWIYMTPSAPNPSVHDIVTGFYEENSIDANANIHSNSFGATTVVINGSGECGKGYDTHAGVARYTAYTSFLTAFGLPYEGGLTCGTSWAEFPWNGPSNQSSHFAPDWSTQKTCKLVNYETEYSIYVRDDYKRCICDTFADGQNDCATASDSPDIPDIPVPDAPDVP